MNPDSEPSPPAIRPGDTPEIVGARAPGPPGQDPLAALREKMLRLTYVCPKDGYVPHCPFKTLMGLSHGSRAALLDRMDEAQLLRMFDLATPCACASDPRPAAPAP